MLSLFFWILFIFLCLALGSKILHRMQFDGHLEQFCFSIGIGIVTFSFIVFFLGILGLLYFWVFAAILIFLSFFLLKEMPTQFSLVISRAIAIIKSPEADKSIFISKIVIFIFILVGLIGSFAPPTGMDATIYHLTVPKLFIEEHRIFNITHFVESFKPFNIQMLYLFGMLMENDIIANLINFLFYILAIAIIFSFTRKFFSRKIAYCAALIFSATPMTIFFSNYVNVDLGLAFFGFLSFYSFVNWLKSDRYQMLILAAIFSGFSLGIDYVGIIFYILLILCVIYLPSQKTSLQFFGGDECEANASADVTNGQAIRRVHKGTTGLPAGLHKLAFVDNNLNITSVKKLLVFISISLSMGAWWYLRNYIATGNPVFPFMANIFGGIYLKPGTFEFGCYAKRSIKECLNLFQLMNMSIDCKLDIGPLYLIFLPCALLLKRIDDLAKIILGYILLACIILIMIVPAHFCYIKYLLPFLPFMSIASAYICVNLINENKSLGKVVKLSIAISVCSAALIYSAQTVYRLPVIIGKETKDSYYNRIVDSYSITKYINQNLDKEAKILLVGEQGKTFQGYYLKRPFILWHFWYNYIDLDSLQDEEKLLARFKELGITHIVVPRAPDWIWHIFEDNKSNNFYCIHSAKGFYLYKIN